MTAVPELPDRLIVSLPAPAIVAFAAPPAIESPLALKMMSDPPDPPIVTPSPPPPANAITLPELPDRSSLSPLAP